MYEINYQRSVYRLRRIQASIDVNMFKNIIYKYIVEAGYT